MRPKPYPLEALRKQRTAAQAAAVLELKHAQGQLAEAEAVQARHAEATAALARRRSQAAQPAARSGADLVLAGAYDSRLRLQQEAQRALLLDAATAVRRCARAVRLAELQLSQAYVEREVIERHHARFAEQARKKAERAAEAELDDLVIARLKRPPSW